MNTRTLATLLDQPLEVACSGGARGWSLAEYECGYAEHIGEPA